MTIIYRPMRPDDEEAILDLWLDVYSETDRAQWQREFRAIPQAQEHTYLAVAPGGTALATAHYWPRAIRGLGGAPTRIGQVSHVATRPAARRAGHASALMTLVIQAMEREGCTWSLLFTSDEGRALYERYGWRTYPTPYREGLLAGNRPPPPAEYVVSPYDPRREAAGWQPLATLYTAYNAARPLTIVRDDADWHGYLGVRILDWLDDGAQILVAWPAGGAAAPCGYALAHLSEQGFFLNELACYPEHQAAIPALLAGIAGHFPPGGEAGGRVVLPSEPAVNAALEQLFAPLIHSQMNHLMLRPLAPGANHDTLQEIATSPGALFWPMDEV